MSDENKPDEAEKQEAAEESEQTSEQPEEKAEAKSEEGKAGAVSPKEEAQKAEEKDDELPEDQRAETNIPEIDEQGVPLWIKLAWAGFVIWLIWYIVMGLQSEPSTWA